MTDTRDYIALITIGGGGGSYYRHADPTTAAKQAAHEARQTWRHVFDIPKDHVWTVSLYDVTAHTNVTWDDQGMFDADTREQIPRHSVEKVKA